MSSDTDTPVFEYCALCGESLLGAIDSETGVCRPCVKDAPDDGAMRETLPDEVYITEADFVKVALKTMTARRMVGWLRGYADYCDFADHDITATHVRRVANRIAAEVGSESVRPIQPGSGDENEDREGEER